MIVTLIIVAFFLIWLVGVFIYTVPDEMKDSSNKQNVVEAQKKAEPTIQISIDLYDNPTSIEGTHYKYQVPLSQAAFYIPNLKDTLVYHDSNFIVREVKRDFNKKKVIITSYKAS